MHRHLAIDASLYRISRSSEISEDDQRSSLIWPKHSKHHFVAQHRFAFRCWQPFCTCLSQAQMTMIRQTPTYSSCPAVNGKLHCSNYSRRRAAAVAHLRIAGFRRSRTIRDYGANTCQLLCTLIIGITLAGMIDSPRPNSVNDNGTTHDSGQFAYRTHPACFERAKNGWIGGAEQRLTATTRRSVT